MIQANYQQQARTTRAIPGRNDACSCGSGRKFKHCCLIGAPKSAPKQTPQAAAVPVLLEAAQASYTSEDFARTSSLLGRVLELEPEQPDTLHLLGILAHRQGDGAGAVALLQRSVAAAPGNATFLVNFGLIAKALQHPEQALELFQLATRADPGMSEAHFNLGTTLVQQGNVQEATSSLAKALHLRPEYPEAINNLGGALRTLGKHEQAMVCFRKAIAMSPGYAAAHSNLGRALCGFDRNSEAVSSLEQAIALDPTFADAYVNLGCALRRLGRMEEAIAISHHALKLKPADLEALLNLGNAYKERGQLALAAEAYRQAVAAEPNDPRSYGNLAETLRDQGKPCEAAAIYEHALTLQPGFATGYSNLLYLHAFTRDIPPQQELALARGWEKAVLTDAERETARQASRVDGGVFMLAPVGGRKLRIGIVSAELGTHAVAEFLQPLLENLDRERFHLTLFPTMGRWEPRAQHLRSLADNTIFLTKVCDADAVDIIRRETIDVLMDTSGHTSSNRLGIFARRAAPVQCTYIGYWSTTGLTEMDWFLSDRDTPASWESHFSEGVWRLPRIACGYHGDHTLDCSQWKPDPSGTIWLGSFNKHPKMREETFALWATVLHGLPEAKLLLEDRGTHDEESHARIRAGLTAHGIAAERVEFNPYLPDHEQHMLLYNRLDIALDTVPFNSGTTGFDAVWMGVPFVALEGDWSGGRMGASLLRALGRPEWIANTAEEYAEVVRTLARDVELRRRLRGTQREQMANSELADAANLTSALQESFVGMYEHWLNRS